MSDLVDQLDLAAITRVYEDEERGYPPYHPVMLTKVLVYAYCRRGLFVAQDPAATGIVCAADAPAARLAVAYISHAATAIAEGGDRHGERAARRSSHRQTLESARRDG